MAFKHTMKAILICSIAFLMNACESHLKKNIENNVVKFSIDHYAINVSDLNRSVSFYQDVFGLKEITNGTGLDYIRWFSLEKEQELHIIEVDSLDKKLPKGVHLALASMDFESFRESLKEKNIPYSDWPGIKNAISVRPDGIKQIYFQDPDGYWIEVNNGK